MERKKIMKLFIFIGLFVLSLILVYGAGNYRRTLAHESAHFKINLPVSEPHKVLKTVVYNIQDQGLPKRLLQPGKIAIGTGHGGGLNNNSMEPLWVQVRTTGFHGKVTLTSTNLSFDQKSNSFLKPIQPNESFVSEVDLDLPRKMLRTSNPISTGQIIYTNAGNGQLLAVVPVKIINSKTSKMEHRKWSGQRPR